jgi:hypothetical protein
MTQVSAIAGGNTCGLLGRASLRRCAAIVALALVSGACGVNGLSFKQDERVDIIRPHDREKVSLPVRIDWTAKNVAVGPDRGTFAVVVDQAPPRSGQTLPWLFRGESTCKGAAGKKVCASSDYLSERGIYTTTATSFVLERVNKLTGNERKRQFHEVTVVLLDAHGRRSGEGAWQVDLEVKDKR